MNRKARRDAARRLKVKLRAAQARKDTLRKAEEAHVRTIARRGSGMRTCLDILTSTTLLYHQPHIPYEVAEVHEERRPRRKRDVNMKDHALTLRLVALADLVNARRA